MSASIFTVKKDVVEMCRRIYNHGYVAANDGNVSARVDDGHIIMTPTGVSKGFLKTQDLVVVDIDGNKVAGTTRPSSESKMHLAIYKAREDVNAVVHAHPATATGFAVAGIPLTQCVLPEVIIAIGSIPIAEYATPGTQDLADVVVRYLNQYDAILMENHGAITVGSDVTSALFKMETMEHFAKIMLVAHQLGNIHGLPPRDVETLLDLRKKFGIRSTAPACTIEGTCEAPPPKEKPEPSSPVQSNLIEEVTRQVMEKLKG
ncbi:class II aldolase/adducin family protein [candidate division KSB1 bacterium]|nr:class II aldolase/adducin family protein [candidate division KSB1 bacterium]